MYRLLFLMLVVLPMCVTAQSNPFKKVSWAYNSTMYEINTRQFSANGKFVDVMAQLPRLKEQGYGVLWLMPIHPIGAEGRKGSLGSPYSIKDYKGVNPEFGSLADFKALVDSAHRLGLHVIMDIVFNHTANDHAWVKEHPEYYNHDSIGKIVHPNGWEDVSELNDRSKKVWKELTDVLLYWVKTVDIDGFRCDVADLVPLEFWKQARKKTDKIKPLFWLAECDNAKYHEVFDASYAWEWMHITEDIAKGKRPLTSLDTLYGKYKSDFPIDAIKLYFTSNHDENCWSGTEFDKYGDLAYQFAVLALTYNGMPMVYNGQEIRSKKRLPFFEKDSIEWSKVGMTLGVYKTFSNFKQTFPAAFSTDAKSVTTKIRSVDDSKIYAFKRRNGKDEMVVIINFSNDTFYGTTATTLFDSDLGLEYIDLLTGKHVFNVDKFTIRPNRFYILYR